jgi:oligopeptide transport system permease protein
MSDKVLEKEEYKNIDQSKFNFVTLDEASSEKIDAPTYSYWKSVARQFFSSKIAITMLIVMIAIILMSFIQPMISGYSLMNTSNINDFASRYNYPNAKFIFGTDSNGQSLFDATWAGARTSILIGVLATFITMTLGIVVGAIWGYSKSVDRVMIEVYNVVSNVPQLLIVIVLSYAFGQGFGNLLLAMTCTSWVGTAYGIRVQVMMYRDREYNLASRTLGTGGWTMISKNIIPYLISYIMTGISSSLPGFISMEVFLSFMGVGLSADVPSLGRIVQQYATNIDNHAYLFWIPLAVLCAISISLYIVGQKLADASDPRTHM